MNDSEIESTKKYLLEHVLYEMEMYLYTFICLNQLSIKNQMIINVYSNAHNLALRNLMSFFGISGQIGKDELTYNSFSFAEQPPARKNRQKYYSPLSKAVNHITTHRFTGYNGKPLDDIILEARKVLYPEIKRYIRLFLHHLETENEIIYTYYDNTEKQEVCISDEIKDERIKEMIETIQVLIGQ